MKNQSFNIKKMVLAALFVAIGYILPLLIGQIPNMGQALLPLHIPVILAGFVCGPAWGLIVGIILPLSRSIFLGMPPLFPTAITMTFELGTYGLLAGFLYKALPKKPIRVFISLLGAMLGGRIVWGIANKIMALVFIKVDFTWELFFAGSVVTALPGIILQLILIPVVIISLEKAKLIGDNWNDQQTRNRNTSQRG